MHIAISKILHMKESKGPDKGAHLKNAIDYITSPMKTQDKKYVGAYNCSAENAYEELIKTKKMFEKLDKRQGYHIILSCAPGEGNPEMMMELTERFVKEYLGDRYEAIYAVHDDKEHLHSHIIFNSVSFVDGIKYRYKKGDWERYIQPITNRLCEEYGLSVIEFEEKEHVDPLTGEKLEKSKDYKEWTVHKDGPFVWNEMIRRDVDACILAANEYQEFLILLKNKGYELKQGKYLSIRPQGMNRYRRVKTLGADYSDERIRERIIQENYLQADLMKEMRRLSPKIIKSRKVYVKKRTWSNIQRRYYMRLRRVKMIRRKAYSKAWKYKDEIKKLEQYQEQYDFIRNNNIKNDEDVERVMEKLDQERRAATKKKFKFKKKDKELAPLYKMVESIKDLEAAEHQYQTGNQDFAFEHSLYEFFISQIVEKGYSINEIEKIRAYYFEEINEAKMNEKEIKKQLAIARSIIDDSVPKKERKVVKEGKKEEKDKRLS